MSDLPPTSSTPEANATAAATVNAGAPAHTPPLSTEVPVLQAQVRDLQHELRRLTLQVTELRQQLWGRKSERYVPATSSAATDFIGELFAGTAAPDAAAHASPTEADTRALLTPLSSYTPRTTATGTSRAERRRAGQRGPQKLDPSLPRVVERLPDPAPAARVCEFTGQPLVAGFVETLEVLAREPARYYVKRFERVVWVSEPNQAARGKPVTTPWPTNVWPRSHVEVSVVAHIAAARYAEHQPLYRQEQQLARAGVPLPRSTQVSLMEQLAAEVAPLTDLLRDAILQSGYVHLDATPLQVCDRTRPGRTREVALWAYRAGQSGLSPAGLGAVWYDYQPTKAIAAPQQVLTQAQFRGILQTDGAGGFDQMAALLAAQGAIQGAPTTGPPAVTHIGCIAHLRRRVFKAVELKETGAAWYLARINRLYRIDRRIAEALDRSARGRAFTPAEREAWRDRVRLKFSVPVFDRLVARATTEAPTVPPKTLLGKALQYLLAQQGPLRRCLTTPGVKLDNNAVENAMRPPKLSERNVLFVGHPNAGPRLAVLTTLVENARQEGLDIEVYLVDVLTRLPTTAREDLPQLLPRAWREARDAQRAAAPAEPAA